MIQSQQSSSAPPMSARSCNIDGANSVLPELTECVSLDRCDKLLDSQFAPIGPVQVCGFQEADQKMMICCPEELITEPTVRHLIDLRPSNSRLCQDHEMLPRFPGPDSRARPVEDKSELCGKWKENGGCDLDRDFSITKLDTWEGTNLTSQSNANREFFHFMQTSCLATCGWADRRGCVDEHPRCEEWARVGLCTTSPRLLAHTCRESCGVCGFLSPFNTEDQVVGGASYSDYKKDNFKCGEFKDLCEINDGSILDCRRRKKGSLIDEETIYNSPDKIAAFSSFSSYNEETNRYDEETFGATIVSDR